MEQFSMFAEENRQNKLSALGDCLERLKVIDWELFRLELKEALQKERKSNVGRPPYDCVLLFKILVLQRLYNLSDDHRSIGLKRAEFNIGITNLVYNICRYTFLERKRCIAG